MLARRYLPAWQTGVFRPQAWFRYTDIAIILRLYLFGRAQLSLKRDLIFDVMVRLAQRKNDGKWRASDVLVTPLRQNTNQIKVTKSVPFGSAIFTRV